MITNKGIIEAINKCVVRTDETAGYSSLAQMGLTEFAFEAVVLRHQDQFSIEAVEKSRGRA